MLSLPLDYHYAARANKIPLQVTLAGPHDELAPDYADSQVGAVSAACALICCWLPRCGVLF